MSCLILRICCLIHHYFVGGVWDLWSGITAGHRAASEATDKSRQLLRLRREASSRGPKHVNGNDDGDGHTGADRTVTLGHVGAHAL